MAATRRRHVETKRTTRRVPSPLVAYEEVKWMGIRRGVLFCKIEGKNRAKDFCREEEAQFRPLKKEGDV